MKPKVIFFIASGVGGAERQAVTISKCLKDDRFEVIYHLFGPKNDLGNFIPKHRKMVYHEEPKFTHNLILHMRLIIKNEKPDIVYGSGMPLNWRLVLASAFKHVKILLRNENYIYTQSLLQKFRLAVTYRFADYIIAQTDEMRDGLINGLHLNHSLVHTMSNAIDKEYIDRCIRQPSPFKDDDSLKFVAVGRFHRDKGFDLLLRAFADILKILPQAYLCIVGKYDDNDPYTQEVKTLRKELGLEDKVEFTGFQTNPYIYVKNADCFVLSSRNEGLPNVMVEALYLGTPVAAYKCIPVIERIVDEGNTGFLAEKENVQSLTEAMLKASKLGRVKSTYHQNSVESFSKVFENLLFK